MWQARNARAPQNLGYAHHQRPTFISQSAVNSIPSDELHSTSTIHSGYNGPLPTTCRHSAVSAAERHAAVLLPQQTLPEPPSDEAQRRAASTVRVPPPEGQCEPAQTRAASTNADQRGGGRCHEIGSKRRIRLTPPLAARFERNRHLGLGAGRAG